MRATRSDKGLIRKPAMSSEEAVTRHLKFYRAGKTKRFTATIAGGSMSLEALMVMLSLVPDAPQASPFGCSGCFDSSAFSCWSTFREFVKKP